MQPESCAGLPYHPNPLACLPTLKHYLPWSLLCSLEAALASPTIPPEIVTSLLNLAEFMEHDDKQLPLDTRTLGALAEKCHAFAKALHYKVRARSLAVLYALQQPTSWLVVMASILLTPDRLIPIQ